MADGEYEVEILLCETRTGADAQVVFGVSVNDNPIWTALDLAHSPGQYTATRRRIEVEVTDGEGIYVNFEPAEPWTVSGILIRRK